MAKNPAKKDHSMVEVTLLRDGSMHGKAGETVSVSHEHAKHLTAIRKVDRGDGAIEEYRIARPADEVVPPVPMSTLTQGEAAALGIRNVVQTPPDTILPKGKLGLPVPGDADYDESLGVNQKPRDPAKKPKALTAKQKAVAKKARAAAAKAAEKDAPEEEEESEEDIEDGESEAEQEAEGEEGESAQT